jgi:hypothetical protein
MGSREERLGRNESAFRAVNERIVDLRDRQGAVQFEIVCECSDTACDAPLRISAANYERARSDGTTFIVSAGHEDLTVERVVDQSGGYVLVQKVGEAAETAETLDPR